MSEFTVHCPLCGELLASASSEFVESIHARCSKCDCRVTIRNPRIPLTAGGGADMAWAEEVKGRDAE